MTSVWMITYQQLVAGVVVSRVVLFNYFVQTILHRRWWCDAKRHINSKQMLLNSSMLVFHCMIICLYTCTMCIEWGPRKLYSCMTYSRNSVISYNNLIVYIWSVMVVYNRFIFRSIAVYWANQQPKIWIFLRII